MMARERRRAVRTGQRAEQVAAFWLALKGYRVLARRFRTPVGEIDLIARRGSVLAFVEVKYRFADRAHALEAITPHQQKRIIRAAAYYITGHPRLAHLVRRFDAVIVTSLCRFRHMPDVFRVLPGDKIW